ncbi:hypothetical protein AMTRI_Chr13g86230 [Amborella trichopoda]
MVYYYTLYHDLGFYMYFLCFFLFCLKSGCLFALSLILCSWILYKIVILWHCLLCNASDQKNFFLENRKFIYFSFICLSSFDKNAFLLAFINLPWIYSELCISLLCSFSFLSVSITLYLYSGNAIIY